MTTQFFYFEIQRKMLAWMGVLGEVDINGQRNIRGSLEPHGREQGVHICLNHLHHFSPGMSFVEQEATEASNTNLSELGIQQHHPCRAPSWASFPMCLVAETLKQKWMSPSFLCLLHDKRCSFILRILLESFLALQRFRKFWWSWAPYHQDKHYFWP